MKAYTQLRKSLERQDFGDIFAIQLMKGGAEMDVKWRSERKK